MDKALVGAVVLSIAVSVAFLVNVFNHNLPSWCANPEGNGNWIVQPLCK